MNKDLNIIAICLLTKAIEKTFSKPLICNWGVDDDGFFVDLKVNESISTNDFAKLEKAILKFASGAHKIKYDNLSKKEVLTTFKDNKYLIHYFNEYDKDEYLIATFDDIQIPVESEIVKSTNMIKAIKLMNVGGSYWLGDANNEQLSRISGAAFDAKADLDEFVQMYNERIERDHRTIGKNLELFTFDLLAGQGLPIWLPNGSIIKKQIRNFLSELEFKYGFDNTYTPILGNVDLYKKSGHWDHYKENIFPPMQIDNEQLVLRPMTCPHHILIYKKKIYSYKQLPVRLCEESMLHRYESSGGLTGLERVREMVLEDTHIFCTPEQVKDEVFNCYNMIQDAYKGLGCSVHQIDLSLHDPNDKEKFHNDEKMWKTAEDDLRKMLKEKKIKFVEKVGEAAFYGPKIDFQVKTTLGRIITMSTIQLDFLLPKKFDLEYKNENNKMMPVIMIHLGVVGTYERLLSILLEQTKGVLPIWLAPNQVTIIPVADVHMDFAKEINQKLRSSYIRTFLDDRDERMSKKIRDAQISKTPYQIIIGDKEVESKKISIRKFGEENTSIYTIEKFEKMILEQIKNKTL